MDKSHTCMGRGRNGEREGGRDGEKHIGEGEIEKGKEQRKTERGTVERGEREGRTVMERRTVETQKLRE